jgi:CHAT domain-containing protein
VGRDDGDRASSSAEAAWSGTNSCSPSPDWAPEPMAVPDSVHVVDRRDRVSSEGHDRPPDAVPPIFDTLYGLLRISDGDAACRYVGAHPELRAPQVVELLVVTAHGAVQAGDPDEASSLLAHAAILCGPDWPDGPAVAAAMVDAVVAFNEPTVDDDVVARAVATAREVAEPARTKGAHPFFLARLLDAAATVFTGAHAATGDPDLLDEAVAVTRHALATTELPSIGNDLGIRLAEIHAATGDRGLLEEAVAVARRVVAGTPLTSSELPGHLNNLALHLGDLYDLTGESALLDEAVTAARQAVEVTPATSTLAPGIVRHHVARLHSLHDLTGERALLDEAITVARYAVEVTPVTSTVLPDILGHLTGCLVTVYGRTGERDLLDEAVTVARYAVAVTPSTSDRLPGLLCDLAGGLLRLHHATGERDRLDEALTVARRAVASTAPDDSDLPVHLCALAGCLHHVYDATGERDLLDEAVTVARRAVTETASTNRKRPDHLRRLAACLRSLYWVTFDYDLLDEAVTVARLAVDSAAAAGPVGLAEHLNDLGIGLAELYNRTKQRRFLDEAVAVARRAVASTPPGTTVPATYLSNLALHLSDCYTETGERAWLDEAVAVARRAVASTRPTDPGRPVYLNMLATRLVEEYRATDDHRLLAEAWSLVEHVRGTGPWETAMLARTRAAVVRQDRDRRDRFAVAAQHLADAHAVCEDLATDANREREHQRDVAQQAEGLLADLAASWALAGNVEGAVELVERDRFWLHAPPPSEPHRDETATAVVWVMASQWETVVVTRDDDSFTAHPLSLTRQQVADAVVTVLVAARRQAKSFAERERVLAAQQRAVDELCEVTGQIAASFPDVDRLVVIPLGICALCPYPAAPVNGGGRLIDRTVVTVAPSLAWARAAAHRPRRHGPRVGAFHPGNPPNALDLNADTRTYTDLVSRSDGDRLWSPTADKVLARLAADTEIGHFSCHGSYNMRSPRDSALHLKTPLTIGAVLDHQTAPWLVNLSACETAVPDLQAAEQLISFPTGFLLGGAAHVLATLWPVGCDCADVVNRGFYEHFNAGHRPADALRLAVQHLRDGTSPSGNRSTPTRAVTAPAEQRAPDDYSHPYWWAPFAHYGSPC